MRTDPVAGTSHRRGKGPDLPDVCRETLFRKEMSLRV